MKKIVELLDYLIRKTMDGSIEWEELDYVDYEIDCQTYEEFINSKTLYDSTAIAALRTVTSINSVAAIVNKNINVCHGFINGLDLYILESVDYSMSFPSRSYSLRLMRIDTENKRKSFNQVINETNRLSESTLNLLRRLATLVFNKPVDESANADEFISFLIDNDKNS